MADKFLWNNKAITTLSGAHNNTTTTISLNPGDGSLFPSPAAGEHFAVTIQQSDGTAEVCYCTSRSVDELTVARGQETSLGSPVAQTYVGGEAVELRVTAGTLNEFSQVTVAETIAGDKTHTGKVVVIDAVADQEPTSILQSKLMGFMSASGGGTVDAITATFSPVFAALTNGLTCIVRASGANTSTTPTFKPDSLVVKTIVRWGNQALIAGDIYGADYEMLLRYNSTNDNWELLNPAARSIIDSGLQPYTAGTAFVWQGDEGYNIIHDGTKEYSSYFSNGEDNQTTYKKYVELILPRFANGGLKIDLKIRSSHYSSLPFTAYARIYRNGVAVGTERSLASLSGAGATQTWIEDISGWVGGDLMQIYMYIDATTSGAIYTGFLRIRTTEAPLSFPKINLGRLGSWS
ncbi:MAG: hypothetical protein ACC707_16305 [Thiohalomonadales bacterium]